MRRKIIVGIILSILCPVLLMAEPFSKTSVLFEGVQIDEYIERLGMFMEKFEISPKLRLQIVTLSEHPLFSNMEEGDYAINIPFPLQMKIQKKIIDNEKVDNAEDILDISEDEALALKNTAEFVDSYATRIIDNFIDCYGTELTKSGNMPKADLDKILKAKEAAVGNIRNGIYKRSSVMAVVCTMDSLLRMADIIFTVPGDVNHHSLLFMMTDSDYMRDSGLLTFNIDQFGFPSGYLEAWKMFEVLMVTEGDGTSCDCILLENTATYVAGIRKLMKDIYVEYMTSESN